MTGIHTASTPLTTQPFTLSPTVTDKVATSTTRMNVGEETERCGWGIIKIIILAVPIVLLIIVLILLIVVIKKAYDLHKKLKNINLTSPA